jgi:NADPH-dependent glutamate synthase beta subunit-like oxidoreductase
MTDLTNYNGVEMKEAQALVEASRCLRCYDAPCVKGCPAGIDIPKFIYRLSTRDYKGSADTIKDKNPLGAICGAVCPAEDLCQKNCSSSALSTPIRIAQLQKFVMIKYLAEKNSQAQGQKTVGKAAIIGGGPSGLTAAFELYQQGFDVTIYEKKAQLGGVPVHEIPSFRLEQNLAMQEINSLIAPGIELKFNTTIDSAWVTKNFDQFDVIYLAAGLSIPVAALPMDNEGMYYGEDFIASYNREEIKKVDIKDKVIVLGGGNTAMDAAVCAKRLGAENVIVMYRRSFFEMPAWSREFQKAVNSGVQFMWQAQPVKAQLKDGRVTSLSYHKMLLGEKDESGRRKPYPDLTMIHSIEVDTIISALGRKVDHDLAKALQVEVDSQGRVIVNDNLQTSNPKIFAGGDIINGGGTVVQAVADGKKAGQYMRDYVLSCKSMTKEMKPVG